MFSSNYLSVLSHKQKKSAKGANACDAKRPLRDLNSGPMRQKNCRGGFPAVERDKVEDNSLTVEGKGYRIIGR